MSVGGARRRAIGLCFALLTWVGAAQALDATGSQIMVVLHDSGQAPVELVATLAKDYSLKSLGLHHLGSLGVDNALFAVERASERDAVVARLATDPRISKAQAVRLHHVAGVPPKDPYFDLQVRTRPAAVSALASRARGRNVRIAIIDTGFDTAHPDLVGQIAEARNFVGGDSNIIPAEFHGTAVTGLIAARAGNGIGIHGLAPDALVYVLRACWEPSYGIGVCSSYTLAQALDYAIEIRARIINLSLAGPNDPLLASLVERAVELGAVVLGAIGEEPGQPFPTSLAEVIAVEQARQGDVEVPGERLTVPGLQLLTTVPGGRYDFVSGPSFATAHATGVTAILLALQPHFGRHEIAEWLRGLHQNPQRY